MPIPTEWPNVREVTQHQKDDKVKKKGEFINEFIIPIEDHKDGNFFNIDVAVKYDLDDLKFGVNEYAKKLAQEIAEFIKSRPKHGR